jgi:threonine dehydrogenase-like Zn-dependent dehydrogenase
MLRPEFDRAQVLREILRACRNGGTISVPDAYVGWVDKLPVGSLMNRSLTIRTK